MSHDRTPDDMPKWIDMGAYEPITEQSIHVDDVLLGARMAEIIEATEDEDARVAERLGLGRDVYLHALDWEDAAWLAEQSFMEACADEAEEFRLRIQLGLL